MIYNGLIPWDSNADLRLVFDDLVQEDSEGKGKRKGGTAKEKATKLTSVSGYTDGNGEPYLFTEGVVSGRIRDMKNRAKKLTI